MILIKFDKTLQFSRYFLIISCLYIIFPAKTLADYGSAAGYTNDPGGPPTCNDTKPNQPWLYNGESLGDGKVKLVWAENKSTTSWTLAYGLESGKYIYGIDRFGDSSSQSIIISQLPSGKYYFAIRGNNNCMPGPFSNEYSVSVGGGGGGQFVSTAKALQQISEPVAQPTIKPKKETTSKFNVTEPEPTTYRKGKATPIPAPEFKHEPKATPTTVFPGSSPEKPGFMQRIWNFIKNLFGS